jgi:hypothetical protein
VSTVIGIDRRVRLGGATRSRGILGGHRSRLEWIGMLAGLGVALAPLVGGALSVVRVVVAVLGAAAAVGAWTPWPGMQGRSAVLWGVWWGRHLARRSRGRSVFALARDGRSQVPQSLDQLQVHALPAGMAAVRNPNPGGRAYYTVAWEMLGSRSGFDKDYLLGADQERFGLFAASVCRAEPRAFGLQQVSRVGSYDMADHVHWIAPKIPKGTNPQLIASYTNLLDVGGESADQTRTWLVARIRESALALPAGDEDDDAQGGEEVDGHARALRSVQQIAESIEQEATLKGMTLRALDEPRLAAVLRGLQDPDHPLDQTQAMTWDAAWAPWETWHPRHLVVHGRSRRWWTRTAIIPADALAPGLLPADFLWPLIGSMTPTLVRTVSTQVELIPADKARGRILTDVTTDGAAALEATGAITDDGTADEQLSLSQQHLVDLAGGSPHQGAAWTAAVTIQAPSRAALDQASKQLVTAAQEAAISRLDFVDGWHEAAICTTFPLGHGMGAAR